MLLIQVVKILLYYMNCENLYFLNSLKSNHSVL